jgi:hypothetical protein
LGVNLFGVEKLYHFFWGPFGFGGDGQYIMPISST